MKRKIRLNFLSLACLHSLLVMAAIFVLLVSLVACKSHRKTITSSSFTSRADTVRITRYQHDTLKVRDSVYIKETQRGDTVFITQFRDRLRYKVALSHDTVYKTLHDTICAKETQIKTQQVETPLSSWQKFRLKYFAVLVPLLLALLAWTFRKYIIRMIRKLI